MAIGAYIGIDGIARKGKAIYVGANGKAKSLVTIRDFGTLTGSGAFDFAWDGQTSYTVTDIDDYRQIQVKTRPSTGGMYQCKKYFDTPIVGSTSATRRVVFFCAMIRGYTTNIGYPWFSPFYTWNEAGSERYGPLADLETGATKTALNDGQWHKVGGMIQTFAAGESANNTYDITGVGVGIAPGDDNTRVATTDKFDIKDVCVFDLTEYYGVGNEPTKAWCTQNIVGVGEEPELTNLPNKARRVKKVYVGDANNIARICYSVATIEDLIDFKYTDNNNGTYTLTAWNGTTNGIKGTEIIIPDGSNIIL